MGQNISKELAWESIRWHLATYKHEMAKNGIYDSVLSLAIDTIDDYLKNSIQPVYCKDCELRSLVEYYGDYMCRDTSRFVEEDDYCSYGRRRQENE